MLVSIIPPQDQRDAVQIILSKDEYNFLCKIFTLGVDEISSVMYCLDGEYGMTETWNKLDNIKSRAQKMNVKLRNQLVINSTD